METKVLKVKLRSQIPAVLRTAPWFNQMKHIPFLYTWSRRHLTLPNEIQTLSHSQAPNYHERKLPGTTNNFCSGFWNNPLINRKLILSGRSLGQVIHYSRLIFPFILSVLQSKVLLLFCLNLWQDRKFSTHVRNASKNNSHKKGQWVWPLIFCEIKISWQNQPFLQTASAKILFKPWEMFLYKHDKNPVDDWPFCS